ncbi:MAG: FAD-dependent oxidoreductase [Candidatus Rokuibacteriota bacterium]
MDANTEATPRSSGLGQGPAGLPVVVIGAGPIGLAAAAHLAAKGQRFIVLEAGAGVGTHVASWGHVQVFSPWQFNVDPIARGMLRNAGWAEPNPDALPTGAEIVSGYLEPLAKLPELEPHVRFGARVIAIARVAHDKMKTPGRDGAAFEVRIRTANGEEAFLARAVIDASGTYGAPNPLGANGLPAIGEDLSRDRIFYGIPDVLGVDRRRYAGRSVLVVGSGHSAFNALLDLAWLASSEPATSITWAIRREDAGNMYGGGATDALPARGSLGARLRNLVESGRIRIETGFRAHAVERTASKITLLSSNGRSAGPVDEIIAVTGFRPDLTMLRELRLDLDSIVESPRALAPLIDPNVHSCGTVPPHGAEELRQPEPDFYIVGMKSYGRAPTFLMLTGYEQVRSVVAELTGDLDGARRVELVLPETGVCSATPGGEGACGTEATSSCGTAPVESQAGCCSTPAPTLIGGLGRKAQ